jgi:hypothetical protein
MVATSTLLLLILDNTDFGDGTMMLFGGVGVSASRLGTGRSSATGFYCCCCIIECGGGSEAAKQAPVANALFEV